MTLVYHNPDAPARPRRALRLPHPEIHEVRASDGVALRLTRYRGGAKGPVILSHCIGVSSRMYTIDTIETTLIEFLCARGFDVWLLDFRFSIALPASREPSTFDDVATRDYPAAVAAVRRLADATTVQIVAHGVGSSTLTMALLSGLDGVRAAVLSQVSTHLFLPPLNRLAVSLRLPSVAAALGVRTLSAYTDTRAAWTGRLADRFLTVYPYQVEERCASAVCHRVTALFGPLYEHDRLNPATHDALHELFGVVNLRAFRQLSLIGRCRHLVDARGGEAYLPHLKRLALPILLLHGSDNACVLPASTEMTQALLSKANGKDLYRRAVIPGYGHVDCMFGARASQDVFPHILDHLEAVA